MKMKVNFKSWKAWAMVVHVGVMFCIIFAGTANVGPPIAFDLDEHPTAENVMDIMGCALLLCAIVLAIVGGRQLPVTWARRLFWLDLISLILFALLTLFVWLRTLGSMPYIVRIISVSLLQLSLLVCFWSIFFALGMISRQTLRRQGFYVLCMAAPPILFCTWLLLWVHVWDR